MQEDKTGKNWNGGFHMLGKSKTTTTTASTTEAQSKIGTIIGPGAVFDGNITAPEAIRIDGKLNGNCASLGNLILGTDGEIKGNIIAQNVIISGKVVGDISASGKLELFSTGRLSGNISARSLVIDEDAFFDGRCTMVTNQTMEDKKEEEEAPKETSDEE